MSEVIAYFAHGYCIRNLLSYALDNSPENGRLTFSPEGISFAGVNDNNTVVVKFSVRPPEEEDYVYDTEEPFIHTTCKIVDLKKILSMIKKKDGIRLEVSRGGEGESDKLTVTTIRGGGGGAESSAFILLMDGSNLPDYLIPYDKDLMFEYVHDVKEVSEIARTFNRNLTDVMCECYTEGVVFYAVITGGITGQISRFGNCPAEIPCPKETMDEDPPSIIKIGDIILQKGMFSSRPVLHLNMKSKTFKSLRNLRNICGSLGKDDTSDNIRFLYSSSSNIPLIIVSRVMDYGTIQIYVRDETPDLNS